MTPNQKTHSEVSSELIADVAAQQIELYDREPRELISHFNRETSALDGYRGRQILELLQNADDAGTDCPHGSRVLFHLERTRLVVANTGTPFSCDGVMSLVISDCSPKQLERNRFIGCKGLGFRSVLTWTTRPLIVSGALCVRFDKAHALATVRDIAARNAAGADVIQRFHDSTGLWPAPVMRFPQSAGSDDAEVALARSLKSQGYDTVLVLPFDGGERGARSFLDAEQQLRVLPTSSMLFCRHLNEVAIRGEIDRRWEILREELGPDNYRVIIHDGASDRFWDVSRRAGKVSKEAAEDISGGRREFETAIAVPESCEYPVGDNCLCVYFPTRDRLPCPILLHATLETTEDRNRLVSNTGNREVLRALASHLADVIEAQVTADEPLRALHLMNGVENADPELRELGFLDAVVSACRTRTLLPRIDGTFGTATDTRRTPHDVWLRVVGPEHFPDVLAVTASAGVSLLLKLFSLQWPEAELLKERLQAQLIGMEPEDAGKVIGQLLHANQLRSIGVGGLLMDRAKTFVDATQECFTNPDETLPELPTWAREVRFLHPAFQEGMRETAGASTLRGLVSILEQNKGTVSEYRFDTVARAVIGRISKEDGAASSSVQAKWRNLYSWLLNASRTSRQVLSQLAIKVITVDGELARATECYLSDRYPGGELVWRLYRPVGKTEFVARPSELGLDHIELSDVEQFLMDSGVRTSPKSVLMDRPIPQYGVFVDYVLETLSYPRTVRSISCDSAAKVRQLCHQYEIAGLKAPEHFGRLLEEGDPAAVAAYLLSTGSADLQTEHATGAVFEATIHAERKLWQDVSVPVPNMFLWWLQNHAWIPCADGKKRKPSEIMLSSAGLRVLPGVYSKHAIDPHDPILQRHGGRTALEPLLMRLGAVASLEAMGSEQVYELLLGLPKRDPAGEAASSIYRTLLEANVSVEDGPEKTRFMREGVVWVNWNGIGRYIDYREARYNANVTVPQVVEAGIALLDLPRRKNAKAVEQLLGVKTLATKDIQLTVISKESEYDSRSEDANAFLRRCVPFVYALRLGKKLDDDLRERNLLKNAHLYVCRRLTVDVTVSGGPTKRLALNQAQERIAIESNLFLVGEYDPGSSRSTRFWQAVAGLVAELLGTDIAAEVGAVLRCRTEPEMLDVVEELLGHEATEKLAEARQRFEEWFVRDDGEEDLVTLLPGGSESTPPDSRGDGNGPTTPDAPTPGPNDIAKPPPIVVVGDKKFEKTTGPEHRQRKRRRLVVRVPGIGGAGGGKGPVATEDVTFRIVEAFERQDGAGRHVINVSHLLGADAFGCDLISVPTEELKQQILSSRIVNDSDIVRFIEVKGRNARTGEIELTENEYAAADKHRGRYYIYRVFVDPNDPDRFEVAVLGDPINSAAVRTVTRFDLVDGSGADWYRVEEEEELGDGITSEVE